MINITVSVGRERRITYRGRDERKEIKEWESGKRVDTILGDTRFAKPASIFT